MDQLTLKDVYRKMEEALESLDEVASRACNDGRPSLSFEQKIIYAVRQMGDGHPLWDFLGRDDIEQAIKTLADVYIVTGVKLPDNLW
jgi:hypothetical protein